MSKLKSGGLGWFFIRYKIEVNLKAQRHQLHTYYKILAKAFIKYRQ